MHYHLEIIMPPTDDVEGRVAEIMTPFDEYGEDTYCAFWDWYVIGGRWAGAHLEAIEDSEKLKAFRQELVNRNVTVSGLICGKETLQPACQIDMVDALWREHFPDSELKACPLFSHFNDQYADNCLDVDLFGSITERLTARKLIIAGLDYEDKKYTAKTMYDTELWNGVNHQKTHWTGNILDGVRMHHEGLIRSKPKYRDKHTVDDDWMVVTVDYHS
jgi:hypothetical protein